MNIRIEDVFTPQSVVDNSIRIPDASGWFPYDHPAGATHVLKNDYTLTGDVNIDLTNVFMELPYDMATPFELRFRGRRQYNNQRRHRGC